MDAGDPIRQIFYEMPIFRISLNIPCSTKSHRAHDVGNTERHVPTHIFARAPAMLTFYFASYTFADNINKFLDVRRDLVLKLFHCRRRDGCHIDSTPESMCLVVYCCEGHFGPKEAFERAVCIGLECVGIDIMQIARRLCRIDRQTVRPEPNELA